MATISTVKHTKQDSSCPLFSQPKPNPHKWLKAAGYGLLGTVTSVAIFFFCTALSFVGAGFIISAFYGRGGDLAKALSWLSATFYTSLFFGAFLSIHPIRKIAGPIFQHALHFIK